MSAVFVGRSTVFAVQAIELEVLNWLDKSDEAGVARLIVKEDKVGEWQGWSLG